MNPDPTLTLSCLQILLSVGGHVFCIPIFENISLSKLLVSMMTAYGFCEIIIDFIIIKYEVLHIKIIYSLLKSVMLFVYTIYLFLYAQSPQDCVTQSVLFSPMLSPGDWAQNGLHCHLSHWQIMFFKRPAVTVI